MSPIVPVHDLGRLILNADGKGFSPSPSFVLYEIVLYSTFFRKMAGWVVLKHRLLIACAHAAGCLAVVAEDSTHAGMAVAAG